MIDVELQRRSLDGWRTNIYRRFRKQLEIAQADIKVEFAREIFRQQLTRGDGRWENLNQVYDLRKEKEYPGREILTRTGDMIAGYVAGIDTPLTKTRVSVVMPYPGVEGDPDRINVRARSHQNDHRQPEGVPPRPFDVEKFQAIATKRINEAMRRAAGNE